MSQAFNVAHAVSRSAPHCACARSNVALPSARSAPCLPPLASGPLSEGPTAERPPRSSSRRSARSRVSPPPPPAPCPPPGPVFLLTPFLSVPLTLAFPVRYPRARAPVSFSRSSPISILFPHFPLRFRRISVVFFFPFPFTPPTPSSIASFLSLFFVFSSSLTP